MKIPDCYDPIHQVEKREADWDRFAANLPVCKLCRKAMHPGQKIHTASCMIVCSSCVEILNDNFEILEEPK